MHENTSLVFRFFLLVNRHFGHPRDVFLGTQNLEVAKLNTDLEKWEFEHDQAFKRWAWEQRQTVEDKKYARRQLEEFGKTVRDGIAKVGTPVAQGFAEGYKSGKRGGNGAPARQESRPQEKSPEDMTDEEVVEVLQKVNTAEKTVEKAKTNILAEVHRRGLNV